MITIYTDGGCKPNPGKGGYGALIIHGDGTETEICGGEERTTNNRMELMGAISALGEISEGEEVTVFTDSKYVRNGITSWIKSWNRNGWRTADRNEVKNADLWKRLDSLQKTLNIKFKWVKGHAGIYGNERADELATRGLNGEAINNRKESAKDDKKSSWAVPPLTKSGFNYCLGGLTYSELRELRGKIDSLLAHENEPNATL